MPQSLSPRRGHLAFGTKHSKPLRRKCNSPLQGFEIEGATLTQAVGLGFVRSPLWGLKTDTDVSFVPPRGRGRQGRMAMRRYHPRPPALRMRIGVYSLRPRASHAGFKAHTSKVLRKP